MGKVIDIREKSVVDRCMDWLEEAVNNTDMDMCQLIVDCGNGIELEVNVNRLDIHTYSGAPDGGLCVDTEYDCYGHVGEIEIFVIKGGKAVDSLTEGPFVDDELLEKIRDLYRTWRK